MGPIALFTLTFAPAVVGGVLALAFDAFAPRRSGHLAAGIGLALSAAGAAIATPGGAATLWGVTAVHAGFSAVAVVVFGLAALVVLGASAEFADAPYGGSYAALVALAACASALAATTTDLVFLLVAIETASACAYALVSMSRTRRASEAAIKYFVQGSVATGLFALALAVLVGLYVPKGSLTGLVAALGVSGAVIRPAAGAIILLLTALAVKIAAAPVHSWAPDAYETAPASASAFMAGPAKLGLVAALGLALVTVLPAGGAPNALGAGAVGRVALVALGIFATLSLLIGSLAALRQASYQRMLAYAGVAQVGYALMALASNNLTAALFFMATYALGTTGAFLAAAALRRLRPHWDGSIAGLAGLSGEAPVLSASLVILLASLAGIPPLVGFLGKFQAFGAAVLMALAAADAGARTASALLWVLVAVAALGAVISLGYYGAVLRAVFEPAEDPEAAPPAAHEWGARAAVAAVVVSALLALALGAAPLLVGMQRIAGPFLLH